jgi:hypothetical protein
LPALELERAHGRGDPGHGLIDAGLWAT